MILRHLKVLDYCEFKRRFPMLIVGNKKDLGHKREVNIKLKMNFNKKNFHYT